MKEMLLKHKQSILDIIFVCYGMILKECPRTKLNRNIVSLPYRINISNMMYCMEKSHNERKLENL